MIDMQRLQNAAQLDGLLRRQPMQQDVGIQTAAVADDQATDMGMGSPP